MTDLWDQIIKALTSAKVELTPLYAIISAAIMGLLKLSKDPNRVKWFTILDPKARAWTVMAFAFGLTFGVSILVLKDRDWLNMTAVSLVVALVAVGARRWIQAFMPQPPAATKPADPPVDPRRP